jgi:hypothetical protein
VKWWRDLAAVAQDARLQRKLDAWWAMEEGAWKQQCQAYEEADRCVERGGRWRRQQWFQ